MRLNLILRRVSILAISLSLSACSQIEQKSDMPDKKVLSIIEAPLKIATKWSTSTGQGVGDKDLRLSLARAGKNLFTVDSAGNVMSINEATGAKNWQRSLNAPISAGPAVGDGKLFFGTSNGKIIAIEAETGSFAWSWGATSEILATPKITNNMVFIHTMDGGLSALSAIDGRQLWRFTYNLPSLVLRRASSPATYKDNIIAGFANGKLMSMHMADGSTDWSYDVAHPKGRNDLQRMVDISADPVVKGDVVYAASYQGSLTALTASTGQLKWERDLPSYAGLAIDNKLCYVAETKGDVVAVDSGNGATFWLQTELQGRRLSKPVIMGQNILVGDEDGFIHWLDKTSGKIVGRFQFDKEGVETAPIVHNNIVYILGRSGKLVALEVN